MLARAAWDVERSRSLLGIWVGEIRYLPGRIPRPSGPGNSNLPSPTGEACAWFAGGDCFSGVRIFTHAVGLAGDQSGDTLEGRAVQSLTCGPGRSWPHLVQTSAEALQSGAHRFDLREVDLLVGISALVK